jgi:hypothetical protein
MTLREYNNQILLTISDSKPVNDDHAKERGNSLRLLAESLDANKWFECRDMCLNNPDCETYKFDADKQLCQLYRKEPYKEVKDLSLNDCTEFCSKDNDCDYLSHSQNNTCSMYSREELKENGKSAIGDLWVNFPIYGINTNRGVKSDTFERCREKLGHDYFVYYDKSKYCVPKRFFEQSPGNTTIYFDKKPYDQYKALNKYIGLKSENRESVDKYKIYVIILWIIILLFIFYYAVKK